MWSPESYQNKIAAQQAEYKDLNQLKQILTELRALPPLVTDVEIMTLKLELAKAQAGEAFILQGGDCAEQFSDCTPEHILNKIKILLQMSLILIHGLKKPVIRVGRIAGQYAKPRSQDYEIQQNVSLPAYRGDIINGHAFEEKSRQPDPARMKEAYFRSGLTLNYVRSLLESGFADLHHPEKWQLSFINNNTSIAEYREVIREITRSIAFFESIAGVRHEALNRVKLYTSHEALHLPYEAALTHVGSDRQYYNLSTHFPWIGMRTLSLEGAHIEYLRGIANPIGIKVGPQADFDVLCRVIEKLNPQGESGKIMLIHRFGREAISDKLPLLLKKLTNAQLPVLFSCDPMHGNTKATTTGYKTRYFADILLEVKNAFRIHAAHHVPLAGIHFEMTGENVTECLGGAANLQEKDLSQAYKSLVDPRLNYEQAMEIAFAVAKL